MPRAVDIAWLAGVFDGEGCVFVQRSKRGHGRIVHSVQLNIANTSAVLVEGVESVLRDLGCSFKTTLEPRYTKTPIYYVKVARKADALALSEAILPYITAKREQVLMASWYLRRAVATRQHVPSAEDRQVLDAMSAVKHGQSIPETVQRLIH